MVFEVNYRFKEIFGHIKFYKNLNDYKIRIEGSYFGWSQIDELGGRSPSSKITTMKNASWGAHKVIRQ